jgi:hypothetical protein
MRAAITRRVPGTSSAGRRALAAVRCHIIHLAMKTLGQPGFEAGLAGGKVGVGDAHIGKTEFAAQALIAVASDIKSITVSACTIVIPSLTGSYFKRCVTLKQN